MAGYARIGLYPNLGVTWWTTMLVRPGRPLVASVAYDLPVAAGTGLHLGRDGLEVRGAVEEPLVTMRLDGHGAGRPLDRPEDVYRRAPGDAHHDRPRSDLDHRRRAVPLRPHHPVRGPLPGATVKSPSAGAHGRVGSGQRDHSWGVAGLVGVRLVLGRRPGSTTALGSTWPISGYPATDWPSATSSRPTGRCSRSPPWTSPRSWARRAFPVGPGPGSGPGGLDLRIEPWPSAPCSSSPPTDG